ncbi:dynamin-binding protein-like isoform X2 [Schistocerca gregaria]|uniref:dynamin-binding protein-like isoform X2 n=1 Tax=Schistocerca gregaria TaxID=7010 RepID=UPI00211DD160|nr:dynamin-binding protein-like isoform X2 [Schistocerca gregaria]
MEKGTVAKVINDFLTTTAGELSLCKGDIVQILEKIDRHWCNGIVNGTCGKVPLNYLIEVDPPDLQNDYELFATIADFPGQQPGDLSFRKGELIIGIKKIDDNWWEGSIGSRKGMFPTTYTWKLDSSYIKVKCKPKVLNMTAKVKMSMKAQLEEEIDLYEGEILTVTEVIDKDWYRGCCGDRIGIFPAAYVTLLKDATDVMDGEHTNIQNQSLIVNSATFNCTDIRKPAVNTLGAQSSNEGSQNEYVTSTERVKADLDNLDVMNILDDDYFRKNMPSVFTSNSAPVTHTYSSEVSSTRDVQHMEVDICPYGVTLYPFYAQFDNELSFHEGEIVSLVRHVSKDWIEGKIDGRKGIFPSSYVNIIVDCQPQSEFSVSNDRTVLHEVENVEMRKKHDILPPNSFAVVLFNFDAQMDSDLTVKQGEVVCVLQQPNQDWCEVKNCYGSSGLCPRTYLASYTVPNKFTEGSNRRLSVAGDAGFRKNLTDVPFPDKTDLNKRRTLESFGYHDKWKNNSIDDLISKNLETLQNSYTWSSKMNYSNRSVADSECPITENIAVAQDEAIRHSPVYLAEEPSETQTTMLQEQSDSRFDARRREVTWNTYNDVNNQCRVSPVLKRQASDRVPHRPAPPVPLPGHKPVHRSIRKPNKKSVHLGKLGSLISAKEKQLHEIKKEKKEIENKLSNNPHENEDSVQEMKYRIRECEEKILFIEADLNRIQGNVSQNSVDDLSKQDCVLQQKPPSDVNSSGQEINTNLEVMQTTSVTEEDLRKKKQEQRQNVISELVFTEKEFVRDLKITYETFNLHNPEFLENRGINVEIVFGNILDVMHLAEDLLDKLQLAMKGKNDDEQCVGPCFLELAERMKTVYGQYCMNHDEALLLLEKYESDEGIQKIFNKGLETLRYQIACFDMGSILIKPVQRILKYPLILNELIKCTEDDHKDKPALLDAVRTITDVATYINEYKRRKDIVLKYLEDGNSTISQKMARLSLHSVAKKSSRLGAMFTSSLGLSSATKDPIFQEYETQFHLLEKTIRLFMKNVEIFMNHIHEMVTAHSNLGESVSYFYQERHSEVEDFSRIQRLISRQFWKEFESMIQRQTFMPLSSLLELFEGPSILIQKCNDKFLDYAACSAKAEKYKDSRLVQEELLAAKNNYEALNSHLLDELPTLIRTALDLFLECLTAFVTARKLFSGKITKQYLSLMDLPLMQSAQADALENFAVKHSLVLNQLARLTCLMKNTRLDVTVKKPAKSSPTPSPRVSHVEASDQVALTQSDSQKTYLKNRYGVDTLFYTTKSYTSKQPLELSVSTGHLVAVIKKQNPMGDSSVWFVDDGANQGFLPSSILIPNRGESPVMDTEQGTKSKRSQQQDITDSTKQFPSPPSYDDALATSVLIPKQSDITNSQTPVLEAEDLKEDNYEEISDPSQEHLYSELVFEPDQRTREFYYAVYSFEGQGPTTLAIKAGQVVNVLQHEDAQGNSEWWLVVDRFGNKGYVPANYLAKYNDYSN